MMTHSYQILSFKHVHNDTDVIDCKDIKYSAWICCSYCVLNAFLYIAALHTHHLLPNCVCVCVRVCKTYKYSKTSLRLVVTI